MEFKKIGWKEGKEGWRWKSKDGKLIIIVRIDIDIVIEDV